jgi:hypothetical protein
MENRLLGAVFLHDAHEANYFLRFLAVFFVDFRFVVFFLAVFFIAFFFFMIV